MSYGFAADEPWQRLGSDLNSFSFSTPPKIIYDTIRYSKNMICCLSNALTMSNHYDGLLIQPRRFFQQSDDFAGILCVKISRRFIGNDNLAVVDQRSGNGDSLLLTAG